MIRTRFLHVRVSSTPLLAAVALLLATSSPALLRAQGDGTELMTDANARNAIQVVIRNTQSKGVPVEPLVRKVREGISKQSDAAHIQSAVKLLAGRLEAAFKALAPTASADEVSAGANALQVGVPTRTLQELRAVWRTRPLTVPLGVLTELVAHKVPTALATKRVRELMERGASNAQLVALGATVDADVAAGLAPDAALELRTKGVMSLLSAPTGTSTSTIVPGGKPPIRP